MIQFFKIEPNCYGLIKIIFMTVLIVMLGNGLLFSLDINHAASHPVQQHYPLLPPSWAVASVWVILLSLMAVSYWMLLKTNCPKLTLNLIPLLFVICLLYPLYTSGFQNMVMSFLGNLTTIVLAAYIAGRIQLYSRTAALLIFLNVLWVSYASFAVFVPSH